MPSNFSSLFPLKFTQPSLANRHHRSSWTTAWCPHKYPICGSSSYERIRGSRRNCFLHFEPVNLMVIGIRTESSRQHAQFDKKLSKSLTSSNHPNSMEILHLSFVLGCFMISWSLHSLSRVCMLSRSSPQKGENFLHYFPVATLPSPSTSILLLPLLDLHAEQTIRCCLYSSESRRS
jgi:hypothetical protein